MAILGLKIRNYNSKADLFSRGGTSLGSCAQGFGQCCKGKYLNKKSFQ